MSCNGWYKLEELLKIKYGKNQKKVQDNENGIYPIYGTGGLMGYSKEYLYNKPSILIGRKGSISRVKYVEHPFWTVDTLFYTEINENLVIPKYLYYKMSMIDFNFYNEGTTIPSLRTDTLNKIEFQIHSLEEQEKIVNILSSLDDKIELNNEMNKTLEEMAQSIFKRWFVDFEFPNEDGQPYKSSGGEMVESELGMIPKGWKVKSLDEALELIIDYRGKTPKKLGSDWSDKGIMALSAKHIKNGKLVNLEAIKYVDNELYEKWMKDKLKTGDVVMTSEAPVGELYYINSNTEYCLSQRVYGLRSKDDILKSSLLYYMLSSNFVKGQILNRSTGTTVVGIRQTELRKVNLIVPPMNLQESISILLDNVLSKKEALDIENANLIQIRNSILPKLMNGDITI